MVKDGLCAITPSVADSTVAVNVRLLPVDPARGVITAVTERLAPSVMANDWLVFLIAVLAVLSMTASAGANSTKKNVSGLAGALMSTRNLKLRLVGPVNALKLN